MGFYELDGISPTIEAPDGVYIAPCAMVIGKVQIGKDVNIWPHAVVRGDNEPITIGAGTNIQEHSLLHTDPGFPLLVGDGCTVGHRAILHGCQIGHNTLIGMGSIVLNGAKIGSNCLVGAGALVTEGKQFPDNSLIVGSPARFVRALDDAAADRLRASAAHYVANGKRFKNSLKLIP